MARQLLDMGGLTFAALLPLLNPPGVVAIFFGLTAGEPAVRQRRQAQLASVATFLILAVFLVAGKGVLEFFGISVGALRVAGGLVVGYTGWVMLTNDSPLSGAEQEDAQGRRDVWLVPVAFPLLAGPGAIGALIALSTEFTGTAAYLGAAGGCFLLCALVYGLMEVGAPGVKFLGETGMGAIRRLLGFFILAIAVDLVALGVGALQHG